MQKRLDRIRIPVYLQFIASYLFILLIVFAVLSPVLSRAISLSKQNYLVEAKHSLDSSATVLHNTFREIYQLPPKLDDYSYYVRLKITAGNPLPQNAYTGMFMTSRFLAKQLATLEYVDEVFLYLSNSGVTFGKLRVYETLEDYLAFDLVYEKERADAVRDWIISSSQPSQVFPAAQARVHRGAPQKYLLVTLTRQSDSVTVGAALSQNSLLDLFGMRNLPENSFLYVTDSSDTLLFAYQYEGAPLQNDTETTTLAGEAYSVLSANMLLPTLTIRLGIPEAYFIEQQRPLIQMVRGIQWAAIGLGAILSVLFALLNTLPVRKLLRGFRRSGGPVRPSHIKEFDTIEGYMHASSQTIEALHENIAQMEGTLRSSILLQLLYGTLSAAEQELAARLIPHTVKPYRVAMFMLIADAKQADQEYFGYYMHQQLALHLREEAGFVLGQISPYKTAVLYEDTQENFKAIKQTHAQLNGDESAPPVSCGVSEAQTGKKNVGVAYRHAQFCLSQDDQGGIRYYDAELAPSPAQPVGFYGMQRLYDYIMRCEKQQAVALLWQIRQSLQRGQQQTAQVFYLVRFVFESVMQDGGLQSDLFVLPEYNQSMTDQEVFGMLQSHTLKLADALHAKRESNKMRWQADMLQYIEERFADGDLYADSIADAFGVSRNMVYKVVRENVGKSLNEYIEHLRMQRALSLLKTTGLTVAEIAAQCGYNSTNTFYKVFKKNYGLSPSNIRE